MIRPVVGESSLEESRLRRPARADLAMDVLQYGMAVIAIVVVTLLAVVR